MDDKQCFVNTTKLLHRLLLAIRSVDFPQTWMHDSLEVTKHMTARRPKWNTKKGFYKIRQDIKYIRTKQEYLLLALSGFLEDGRQRKAERSSSK